MRFFFFGIPNVHLICINIKSGDARNMTDSVADNSAIRLNLPSWTEQ